MRRGRMGFWFRFVVSVAKPLLLAFTRRDWRGQQHIPATGGVIVAANHVAHVDPFVLSHFVYDSGRLPRFLAKSELFRGRFVGRVLRGTAQVPVHRRTADASVALRDAVDALRRGECVVIYPEGTITRDPDGWPMVGKTGVARLALTTGVPVIPVAQWGAQRILPAYTKRLHLLPRNTVSLRAGPPVDLSRWAGPDPTLGALREATDAVMADIRRQLSEIRGAPVPERAFDPRAAARASDSRSA